MSWSDPTDCDEPELEEDEHWERSPWWEDEPEEDYDGWLDWAETDGIEVSMNFPADDKKIQEIAQMLNMNPGMLTRKDRKWLASIHDAVVGQIVSLHYSRYMDEYIHMMTSPPPSIRRNDWGFL